MNANDRKTFGEKVREERKARGWTQPQLADRANVSTGTVSATERGLSSPQPGNLISLSRALDIAMNGDGPDLDPDFNYGTWFEALPMDARSCLFMIALYLERLGPDERDARIRQITQAVVDQSL